MPIQDLIEIEQIKPLTKELVEESAEALHRVYIPTVVFDKEALVRNMMRSKELLTKMGF